MKTVTKDSMKKDKARRAGKLHDKICRAVVVRNQMVSLAEELETLKEAIRHDSEEFFEPGMTTLDIATDAGQCQVVRVKDRFGLIKGVDAESLQKLLPEETWNLFFYMKPTMRSTAAEAYKTFGQHGFIVAGYRDPFVSEPQSSQVKLPK